MTNIDQLAAEMELGDAERRRLAGELTRLRRLESECRRLRRRLPHQVQTALAAEPANYEIDPPAPAGSVRTDRLGLEP